MEEQAQLENVDIAVPEIEDEDDVDYGPPRGTVAFITLMLIGYIIYYGLHYIEIFILRGA